MPRGKRIPALSSSVDGSIVALGVRLLQTLVARATSAAGTVILSFVLARSIGLDQLGEYTRWAAVALGVALLARFGTTAQILKHCGIAGRRNQKAASGADAAWYHDPLGRYDGRFFDGQIWTEQVSDHGVLAVDTEFVPATTNGDNGEADGEKAKLVYHSALQLGVVASIVFLVVLIPVLWKLGGLDFAGTCILLTVPLVAFNYTNGALLRANNRSHLAPLLEFGSTTLLVSMTVGVLWVLDINFGLDAVAIATTASAVLLAIVGRRWVTTAAPELATFERDNVDLNYLRRNGTNFFLLEASQYFSQWGLLLIVGSFVTDAELGTFSTVLRLTYLVNFVLGVTSNTISTPIAQFHQRGDRPGLLKLRRNARLMMVLYAAPIAGFLLLLRTPIAEAFALDPAESMTPYLILIGAQIFNVLTGISPIVLKMTGQEATLTRIVVATFVIQFLLSWILVASLGLAGAALTLGFGLLMKNSLSALYERFLNSTGATAPRVTT